MKFELTEIREEKLQGFDNILDLFDADKKQTVSIQELIASDTNKTPKPAKPKLEITIEWQPRLPVMVKAGYEGIGVDMLPVTSGVADGKLSLVLAGSSIKGAFRSQAERIVRTLKPDIVIGNDFNTQIIVPIVSELFGGKKEKDNPNQPKSKVGLGALSIDDCYSVESFNQDNWRKVETAKVTKTDNGKEVEVSYSEQELWQAIETVQSKMTNQTKIPNPHFHISHHTAIDRFTGGVAEGALYSVLAPHNIEWQPIKMSLDFGRTENNKCCLMLLLLVLRDLAENRLPLGFATNRGMGEIEVEKIEITGNYNITWKDGKFVFTDENQKKEITGEWQKWAN